MKSTRHFYTVVLLGMLLAVGVGMERSASGQTNVDITTDISSTMFGEDAATSILQYGTGNSTQDIRFTFDKLDTVNNGSFAGSHVELKAVVLTFEFETGTATLTVENDDPENTFTFQDRDETWMQSLFSGESGRKWDWDMASQSLLDTELNPIAQRTDFENILSVELNETVTLQPAGEEGSTVSESGTFDEFRNGTVSTLSHSYYDGAGTWNFDLKNSFPILIDVEGGTNITAGGSAPDSTFYTSVEYVVIPEPGSAMLVMLLAGGGLAARRVVRRRRNWAGAAPPTAPAVPERLSVEAPGEDDFQERCFEPPFFG